MKIHTQRRCQTATVTRSRTRIFRTFAIPIFVASTAASCGSETSQSVGINAAKPTESLLAFESPDLQGLCEDVVRDFAEGEASPWKTEPQAVDAFVAESSILKGLDLADGIIELRGEAVGSYKLIERPENTYEVGSAEWCYPASQ